MIAAMIFATGQVIFSDVTAQLGLKLGNSAACWVDLNNDGWDDLITGGKVWLNKEGKSFAEGQSVGSVVAADFDNDGWVDLFSWSQLKLFRGNGEGKFQEVPLPELPKTVSRGACWGDFNTDGFVDLYVGGFENWNDQVTYPDLVLMNQQGKSFELAWQETKYRARGVTSCDYDADGDLDVYVSNYRLMPNRLWLNNGNGKFSGVASERQALATSPGFGGGHSIGAAWGDFDSDGRWDLFAGNFAHVDNRGDQPKSRFLRQFAKGTFEDLGTCGVFYQESYASPSVADFNNDGSLDLYFTTVYATASFGRKNYPVLFQNGGKFKFDDVTQAVGLEQQPATYQAAWSDFDNDGDMDLVTGGKLFANQGASGDWIKLKLVGQEKINRSAVGAQVRITVGEKVITRQVEAGTGEGNQNSSTLHFGLGNTNGKVDVEILWPGGKRQAVRNLDAQALHTISAKPQ